MNHTVLLHAPPTRNNSKGRYYRITFFLVSSISFFFSRQEKQEKEGEIPKIRKI